MTRSQFPSADARPRIHVREFVPTPVHPGYVQWSFGPHGKMNRAATVGEAVEAAIGAIQNAPAVIIFEGERV